MKPPLSNHAARFSLTCGTAFLAGLFAWTSFAQAIMPPDAVPLGSLQQSLVTPSRVAADANGKLFVSDPQAGQVVVFDAFGRFVGTQAGLAGPLGIAVDAQGNIYLAESGLGKVTVLDAQWNPLYTLGVGAGEFVLPGYIALDAVGSNVTVYVSDGGTNQVRAYENGALVRTIGGKGSGPGQFNFPAGICVNAAGDLFVVDQNNERVQVFNRAGTFLRFWTLHPPGVNTRSGRSQGITVDAEGRLFVADTFQGYVKAFDENGELIGYVGSFGRGAGELLSPGGLTFDSTGRLFVASPNAARVEVFGVDCYTQYTSMPAGQVVAVGGNASFSVEPSCPGPYTYQWRNGTNNLVDGGTVSGATNAMLMLTGVTAEDAGTYTVLIGAPGVEMVSSPAVLIVVSAPTITRSPASRTAYERGSTSFDVLATGEALTYQWLYGGNTIAGANDRILTITNLHLYDAGSYSVIVSNVAGSQTSAAATLTLIAMPVIGTQPQTQTVPEWATLNFLSDATGSPTMAYQWYWKNLPMAGRTTNSFILTNANQSMNGNYYMVAINAAGRATSSVATVTVVPDTVPPRVLSATGGYATNRTIIVAFSKAIATGYAQNRLNYTLSGEGAPTILSAVLTNATNVILTLSGPRSSQGNYVLQVKDIRDTAYTPNILSPNPTSVPMATTVEFIGINSQPWKYWQVTNNVMDSVPWTSSAYSDITWSNGFGLFYGNRSNSVYQPNPNPNVKLPLTLNSVDPNNTKAYTIVNVFTNSGNAVREITYYYRTAFVYNGETNGSQLQLRTIIKQGAVFYLNGTEVMRIRMPSTPTKMTYSTLASSSGNLTWEPAWTNAPRILTTNTLVTGTNVLAVEVHQSSNTSSDSALGVKLDISVSRFVAPVPDFNSAMTDSGLQFQWNDPFYLLESASSLDGPWTTVSTLSPVLVPKSQMQDPPVEFYRLRRYL